MASRTVRALACGVASILTVHALSAQANGTVAPEFERLHFRSIGPATMSGRIADLAVYEANPAIYFVATAHGGLWKTTSNGALFTPMLQDEGLMSMGAVTISQTNPNLVWAGTGEANNRQSTSWGQGIYKSTDGGAHWQFMGLKDSKHIGRIVIDATNNDVVLVAAGGPLFGPGGDRGLYKTTDGGRTWKNVLKVDEETGATDIVASHEDPKVLFAATYQRERTTCCMNGGGPGSGIWKSTDGGDTWTRLSGGLPTGSLGRIGLSVFRHSSNLVFASIEGPGGRGGGAPAEGGDTAAAGGGGRGGRAGGGGGGGGGGGVAGVGGVYRSDDGGATWKHISGNNPRPMYFSQIRIDPNSPDRIYQGGVGLQMSIDGGVNFEQDAAYVTHDDIHAIWIDPSNSNHMMIGNDGGLAVTYDMSKTWIFIPNLPVGLFYHVGYDMEYPYNVCGGMQDNYDWCGPSASRFSRGIMNYDWIQTQGGDGFVAIPDLRNSRIIYQETQDGSITRKDKVTGESKSIRPTPQNVVNPTAGEAGYRFHWDTPLMFSPHDPGTLLVGANHVFKSTDRGDSWTMISPDLTTNANRDTITTMGLKGSQIAISRNDGISQWPAIVSLAESPKQPGVYYAGTDDGNVSASKDGGAHWTNITKNLPGFPKGYVFVSRITPSKFDAGTVYIVVDNHRENDYETHMWVSADFGATFRSMNANLSGEAVKTITEDTHNPDVLYIGTETGIFLSLDRGKSWRRLKANFPTVRVDEITLHPRDNAMLVATHGRALWILDHLEPIQEYTAAQSASADAKLFSIPAALEWKTKDDRNDEFWGHQFFIGENPPTEAVIQYYLKRPVAGLSLRISDASGAKVRDLAIPGNRNQTGIQTVCWDLRVQPIEAPAPDSGFAPSAAGGRGGRGGRAGGAGGRGAGAAAGGAGAEAQAVQAAAGRGGRAGPVPDVPGGDTPAGYMPMNPCGGGAGGGGGGGGGRGGGGGPAGPQVLPGTYTVALMVDGKAVDSKPMKIVMDPQVQLTGEQRARYNAIVMDLHGLQQRGTVTQTALNELYPQMTDAAAKVKADATIPAATKAAFEALQKEFDGVRVKFGVPTVDPNAAGGRGGRGGGGRGGPAANPEDVFGRAVALKGQIMGIWEMPSDALMKQYNSAKVEVPKAIADANALLTKANAMSGTLVKYNIVLRVPQTK